MQRTLFTSATALAVLLTLFAVPTLAGSDADQQSEIKQLKAENKELKAEDEELRVEMKKLAARFDKLEKAQKVQTAKIDANKQERLQSSQKIIADDELTKQSADQASRVEPAAGIARRNAGAPSAVSESRWAGPYVGADLGLSYNSYRFSYNVASEVGTEADSFSFVPRLKAGYRWQTDNTVLGLEGDFGDNVNSRASHASTAVPGEGIKGETGVEASLRGVAGIAMEQSLLYVTAGGALANTHQVSFGIGGPEIAASNFINFGGIAGFGYEHAWNDQVSIDLGYTDSWFPQRKVSEVGGPNIANDSPSFQELKAGMNYKF